MVGFSAFQQSNKISSFLLVLVMGQKVFFLLQLGEVSTSDCALFCLLPSWGEILSIACWALRDKKKREREGSQKSVYDPKFLIF